MTDFFDSFINRDEDDDDNRIPSRVPVYLDQQRHKDAQEYLFIGGSHKLPSRLQDHCLILGVPGSGKNKLLNPQIAHAIPLCRPGKKRRMIVFSYKGDEIQWITPICQQYNVALKFLALNDQRAFLPEKEAIARGGAVGYAWDFAMDTQ